MYYIDKFPIIILSSPRTGSNLLATVLAKNYPDLKSFLEPDETNNMENFIEYSNNNKKYILKFHLKQLYKYPTNIAKDIFANNAFLIRVRRRNLIDQIVSNYIELCRNVWYYDIESVEKYKDKPIDIDNGTVRLAIYAIKNYNRSIDNLKINYDLDLYYEDLIKELGHEASTFVTPRPVNYIELYQVIENQLNFGK